MPNGTTCRTMDAKSTTNRVGATVPTNRAEKQTGFPRRAERSRFGIHLGEQVRALKSMKYQPETQSKFRARRIWNLDA